MRTTFSRNSNGWEFGPDRHLGVFAPDTIRRAFDPRSGELNGARIEGLSVNHVGPLSTGELYAATSEVVPDNRFGTALTLTAVNQTDVDAPRLQLTSTGVGPGNTVRYAIVRRETSRYVSVGVSYDSSRPYRYAVFDLDDVTVKYAGFETMGEFGLIIEDYGDGYFFLAVSREQDQFRKNITIGPARGPTEDDVAYAPDGTESVTVCHAQYESGAFYSAPIVPSVDQNTTCAADFFDAPGANNEYGPGLHTWQCAVCMSRDPGEPTVIGYADGRIYASDGRLHIDGPGTLWQPDGEHAPGALVPFYWTTQFAGATPDFALGRGIGDTDWWNGHLADIVPYPRTIREAEIRRELGL